MTEFWHSSFNVDLTCPPKVTFPILIDMLKKFKHFYIDIMTDYHNIKSACHYIIWIADIMLFIGLGKTEGREDLERKKI